MDCPCCKQKLPPEDKSLRIHAPLGVVVRGDKFAHLTQSQMTILVATYDCRPNPAPIHKIVDALYGHREDGGPEDPLSVLRAQAVHLNHRLKKLGVCVSGDGVGRRGAGYLFIEGAL